MSKSISTALAIEKNKIASPNAWVWLLQITLPDTTVYRYTNNNEDVTFDGDVYTAFPFIIDNIVEEGSGEIPTTRLRVSNVTRALESKLEELDGGVGSAIVLNYVNLDNLLEDYSDLQYTFEVLSTSTDVDWVSFSLGIPSPLRQQFPIDRYNALSCSWEFKGVECAYTGAETTCNRTLTACRAYSNEARFGGFPGLKSGGLRLVR